MSDYFNEFINMNITQKQSSHSNMCLGLHSIHLSELGFAFYTLTMNYIFLRLFTAIKDTDYHRDKNKYISLYILLKVHVSFICILSFLNIQWYSYSHLSKFYSAHPCTFLHMSILTLYAWTYIWKRTCPFFLSFWE